MSKRKPLSPEAKAAAIARLNDRLRKTVENLELRKKLVLTLTGVLSALDQQPRDE